MVAEQEHGSVIVGDEHIRIAIPVEVSTQDLAHRAEAEVRNRRETSTEAQGPVLKKDESLGPVMRDTSRS